MCGEAVLEECREQSKCLEQVETLTAQTVVSFPGTWERRYMHAEMYVIRLRRRAVS